MELIEEVTIRDFLFGFYEQKGNNSIQVNAYVISKAPNLLTKPGNQVPNELQRGEYLEKLFEKLSKHPNYRVKIWEKGPISYKGHWIWTIKAFTTRADGSKPTIDELKDLIRKEGDFLRDAPADRWF